MTATAVRMDMNDGWIVDYSRSGQIPRYCAVWAPTPTNPCWRARNTLACINPTDDARSGTKAEHRRLTKVLAIFPPEISQAFTVAIFTPPAEVVVA